MLGQDQRPGWESWRTDSIMVIALDREAGQVGIISIPRDLWVDIPGYPQGQQRINAVDYIGEKMELAGRGPRAGRRASMSDTLGIPTQHYVRIHLNGLVRLVDALGGVKVTLDCPLYEATPKDAADDGVRAVVAARRRELARRRHRAQVRDLPVGHLRLWPQLQRSSR